MSSERPTSSEGKRVWRGGEREGQNLVDCKEAASRQPAVITHLFGALQCQEERAAKGRWSTVKEGSAYAHRLPSLMFFPPLSGLLYSPYKPYRVPTLANLSAQGAILPMMAVVN